ncbi:MAG: N-acetyltransferase [Bacteroidota bacterium]
MEYRHEIYPGVSVEKTSHTEDLQWCARLMAANEPWITLKRDYENGITLLQDPLSEVFLFTQKGERIGFIMLKLKGAFTGYIQTVVFSEAVRGKGIGEAAIRFAEELIFRVSPNVFICVSSFNTGARKLYLRLGYEVVGVLKDYIIQGYDEVFMRKTRGPLNDFKTQSP